LFVDPLMTFQWERLSVDFNFLGAFAQDHLNDDFIQLDFFDNLSLAVEWGDNFSIGLDEIVEPNTGGL